MIRSSRVLHWARGTHSDYPPGPEGARLPRCRHQMRLRNHRYWGPSRHLHAAGGTFFEAFLGKSRHAVYLLWMI